MMSDQNPWRIEVYADGETNKMSGPLIMQIDDAMTAITAHNPPVEIRRRGGMYRRFPSIAVREALTNAVIHSDLSANEHIMVSMEEDCLSVSSPGGVFTPDEWRDISSTNPRNRKMAELLIGMRYASLKGKGMTVMKNCYIGSGLLPCIIHGQDRFTVKLPAMDNPIKDACTGASMISDYLMSNRGALISEISRDLMISVHITKKMIDSMESKGDVFTLGIGSHRRAFLTRPTERKDRKTRINQ